MTQLLLGKDVANKINEESFKILEELKVNNIRPSLAIIRVGNKDSDISYEKGILKRALVFDIDIKSYVFDEDVDKDEFYKTLDLINNDENIHSILLLRPLPKHLDEKEAVNHIDIRKDVDCCSDISLGNVFIDNNDYFYPCTAEAVLRTFKYCNIELSSKNVVIIGRSLVIGKPLAMMLLKENATVTICHSKTNNIKEITKKADIIVSACGQMEYIDKSFISSDQIIIDVGIHYNENKQKLCGDVLFDDVKDNCKAITPVPGGIGSITNAILINHILTSTRKITIRK